MGRCLVEREGVEKSGGANKFSLPRPLQNTISPNWRENWSKKWEKYLNKTVPPLLTFLASFFFFLLFLSLVTLAFCFCFWFFQWRGGSFFFSFFFFFNFLIFFLKKTLLDDFLCYFLKCPLSSIHNLHKWKFFKWPWP